MKKIIYTLHDAVTSTYWHPFYAYNHQEAMRSIGTAVNTPGDNDLFLHPEDFTLYAIGEFNDQTNEIPIQSITPVELVCRCDTLVNPIKKEVQQ